MPGAEHVTGADAGSSWLFLATYRGRRGTAFRSAAKRETPRIAALYHTVGKQPVDLMRSLSSLLKNEALKSSTFPNHAFHARSLWSGSTFRQNIHRISTTNDPLLAETRGQGDTEKGRLTDEGVHPRPATELVALTLTSPCHRVSPSPCPRLNSTALTIPLTPACPGFGQSRVPGLPKFIDPWTRGETPQ